VERIGGRAATIQRSEANLTAIEEFVDQFEWVDFLASSQEIRSNTSVCLNFDLTPGQVKWMVQQLGDRGVAYDVGA
jgi:phosphoserine aminotransferase